MADVTRESIPSTTQRSDSAERIGSTLSWIIITAMFIMFAYGYVPHFI